MPICYTCDEEINGEALIITDTMIFHQPCFDRWNGPCDNFRPDYDVNLDSWYYARCNYCLYFKEAHYKQLDLFSG